MGGTSIPDPAEAGRQAALDGRPSSANPYPTGSAQHVTWQMGYDAALGSDESEEGPGDVA